MLDFTDFYDNLPNKVINKFPMLGNLSGFWACIFSNLSDTRFYIDRYTCIDDEPEIYKEFLDSLDFHSLVELSRYLPDNGIIKTYIEEVFLAFLPHPNLWENGRSYGIISIDGIAYTIDAVQRYNNSACYHTYHFNITPVGVPLVCKYENGRLRLPSPLIA